MKPGGGSVRGKVENRMRDGMPLHSLELPDGLEDLG